MFYRFRWVCVGWCVAGAAVATWMSSSRPRPNPFDAPDEAARYFAARRLPRSPEIDAQTLYARAAERVSRMPRFASRSNRMLPTAFPASSVWRSRGGIVALGRATRASGETLDAWTPLGPGNIGGRTRAVAFHPDRFDTMYAAGVSGGVWRTDDAGASWVPLGDGLVNIAVNALVIDRRHPDVMYAGTGEGYLREEIRGTGLPIRGNGIFVTRDGGADWQQLRSTATADFLWVNDLVMSHTDSRRLYAATRTGVWRSVDAGDTWRRLLDPAVLGGCLDLVMRTDRPEDVLFASCGTFAQATIYRFANAAGSEPAEAVLSEPGMGRTSIAIAPSNPDVMYALAAGNDPGPGGRYAQALFAVFRSDRGGDRGTWSPRVTNADRLKSQTLLLTNPISAMTEECGRTGSNEFTNMGWYTNVIAVDPRDADRVWAAGVDWFRSDDGGRTWGMASHWWPSSTTPSFAHADQHQLVFHPDYDGDRNQVAIIANDGGVFRTENARATVANGPLAPCNPLATAVRWESLNHGFGVTQFYHGAVTDDGAVWFGGTQDNGTVFAFEQGGFDQWLTALGGDGGYVAIDPVEQSTVYAETQWADIRRTATCCANFRSVMVGLDPVRSSTLGPDGNYLFITPFMMDPRERLRLWIGGDYLYRTENGAEFWRKASVRLPDGGLTSALAIARADSNRVVAGTTNGYILSSHNALNTTAASVWSASRPRDGWVTSVTLDPQNGAVVYATYGNFGGTHVFKSSDGGATWLGLDGVDEGALPDIPVHSLAVDSVDSDRLYLGTDSGVFVSLDGGRHWNVEHTGIGPAITEWLTMTTTRTGRRLLFAFTHGRGVWRVELN